MFQPVGDTGIKASIRAFEEINEPGQNREIKLKKGRERLEIGNIALIFYR